MSEKVTMNDIAGRLDISVAAVSKAMSGKSGVSDELRQLVMRTAEEMGYKISRRPDRRSAHSGNIGIIIPERFINDNAFYFKFIRGITAALQKKGRYALFHTLTESSEKKASLPDIFMLQQVDGIIILGQLSGKYIKAINAAALPVVYLDFYDEQTADSCIVCDNFYAGYEMTNYLISNGHREIAFVGNIHATSSIQDRFLGYVKSLMEHNLDFRNYFLISDRDESGKFTPLKLPDIMPTAFVCNCDETAFRLITVLKENGVRVPEDVSVTGFDNSVYSSMITPNITTFEVNTVQMSAMAVEAVMKQIENPSAPMGMVQVKGKPVFKESVRSINNFV